MRCLVSIDAINAKAPYHVSIDEKSGALSFVSDNGVDIVVDFMEDELIRADASYQLVISNANNKKSPRDRKIKMTVLAIVEEFFHKNQAAILFLCETGDGKQQIRNRMFSYWFDAYEYNFRFSMNTTCVVDEYGIENFAALILRNDHPRLVEIVSEFTITAKVLRDKPAD